MATPGAKRAIMFTRFILYALIYLYCRTKDLKNWVTDCLGPYKCGNVFIPTPVYTSSNSVLIFVYETRARACVLDLSLICLHK